MSQVSFLQSSEWQEIQERMGRPTERISGVLVVRHDLPFGFRYLYAPRPVGVGQDFFSQVKERARSSAALFFKIDPADDLNLSAIRYQLSTVAAHSLQPRSTVRIDCQQTDGEILGAMHPKTRYNIRLAERRGVEVRAISAADRPLVWDAWMKILHHTAGRDKFDLHPPAHYRILTEAEGENFKNEFWFAEWQGKLLAAVMVNWFKPSATLTYLHGGSFKEHSQLMAPHLLHWRVIQAAKRRGYRWYDLGGVDDERWPGLSRFKRSFGGQVFTYPPARDIVFRPQLYRLYRLQRKLRRGEA